jgi:hypothetical protein
MSAIFVLLACLLLAAPARVAAESAPILIDGFFTDWTGPVEHTDAAGDGGASGIDFRDLDLANDGSWVFIRFQTTAFPKLQETNNLELYLDTDLNSATGLAVGGIGAELQWRFGARTGTFFRAGTTSISVFQDDIRLRELPSVTSNEFEIAIPRDVRPDGVRLLFPGASFEIVMRDVGSGGDQVPSASGGLLYAFDSTPVPAPSPTPFARDNPTDVRFVTWNMRNWNLNAGQNPAVDRVLSAIDPQVIVFEELRGVTAAATKAQIETFLPSGPGQSWSASQTDDVILLSRFPILGKWDVDTNIGVLLDADAALGHDIVLVGAHLPCCTDDVNRQDEADHTMSFFHDAMTPGGLLTVPTGTAFIITGDLNLVGFREQLVTLLTGDIMNNVAYGPDFAPDWDGTSLSDVVSRQTQARFSYTWRSDTSPYAPGRIDYFIYNDSAIHVDNHFIVYTPEMSPDQLALYGLQANDVPFVTDHLPHVADFRAVRTSDVAGGAGRGGDTVHILAGSIPSRGTVRFAVQLDVAARLRVELFDVRGNLVRVLERSDARPYAAGLHEFQWDGQSDGGRRVASGTYVVRVTAAPTAGTGATAASRKVLLIR